ncbi:class I SAM-dependent methyltransferase [Candidatus Daviesbacteria bacterium]|nr:class I SAM-dependent methyltransferase [Candidatus Daviesbacteria bacterium]
MKPKCLVCRSLAFFLLSKGDYNLYKCPSCQLVFVWPPKKENFLIKKVYNESGYQASKHIKFNSLPQNNSYKKVFEFLTIKKGLKILDVGCSSGEFLYMAKKIGLEGYGVEVNKITAMAAKKNGLKVKNCTLEQAKFKTGFFGYIFLGDVIEHLVNPASMIRECKRILKRNGKLVIITPNLDCFWANLTYFLYKTFHIPWSSVTPPYHLFQFSTSNLHQFMAKFNFKPEKIWYNPPPKLSYELWFTGLPQDYNKNINNFLRYYTVYMVYGFFYILNKSLKYILTKDNSICVIYSNCKRL